MADEGHRLDDSEPYYTFYERLNLLNIGRWNGKWRVDESWERMIDRMNILDAVISQLELTKSQKNWAKPRFKQIDLRPYTKIGGIYIVAFCICAVACESDGRRYHPSRSAENNDPEFVRFAESVGFLDKHLHKAYGKVRAAIAE
jgi:hypothetical protein